jgi:purine catabolism regulator
MWTTITVKGEEWGRLHVVELDSQLGDATRLALGRASASIALYLMAERDAALSDAAESSLVGALAFSTAYSGQDFLARAGGLGVDLDGELVMIVVAPTDGQAGDGDESDAAVELRKSLREERWPAVVGAVDGNITAVLTARSRSALPGSLEAILGRLEEGPFAGSHVGVSRPCTVSQLPQAQNEAAIAHRLGPSSGSGRVHFYGDLALFRLLSPLGSGPTLANFAEEELSPLIEHDARQNSELLKTLDAFLRAHGNKIATARLLQLGRRSVYYRLDRIEELLGTSLDDPELRVRLYIALRAREMLQADGGASLG